MRIRPRQPKHRPKPDFTANQDIRAQEMRVIDEHGGQLGVMTREEALRMAEQNQKDLVLIAAQANPPVVKLIDISKHKYQLQQRKDEVRKLSKPTEIKELRLSPFIAQGDLEARIKRVREFLEDNDKVRLLLRFKGREITKKEFGEQVLRKVFQAVEDIAQIEVDAKLQGKMMTMQIMPAKKKKAVDDVTPSSTE